MEAQAITIKEKYQEIAERKRAELQAALERGEVNEPFSLSAFFISLGVSAALSTASYFVSRAMAPKPPRLQQGKLSGSLQLQNSEQGIFIPEIYGASPIISLTAGSNPTYVNTTNVGTGAGGAITKNAGGAAWNAGASHATSVVSGDDAFFEFTVGTGYATAGFTNTASPVSGNTDFLFGAQWNPDGSVTIKYSGTQLVANVTHWVTGDRFRVELRSGRFRLYKGYAEIRPQNFVPPTPTYPCYLGIAMFTVGAGVSEAKVKINSIGTTPNAGRGGIKVPAIIVYSSKIRKNVTTTQQPTGGGKGGGQRTQTVENINYDIDLGLEFSRGPNKLLRLYANADVLIDDLVTSLLPTGVHDPGVAPDPDYTGGTLPDPTVNYTTPILRESAAIAYDGDGVASGSIQGGGALITVYQGTETQDPDPTIEADIDALYGSGSTPAYRGKTLGVLKQLVLTRWGGIVPNFTAVWEHTTLKTFGPIFGSLCERVGVLAANSDYSFTNLTGDCRGLLIAGRPFKPAEIIGSPEIQLAGNFFVTEAEGQIIGYAEGGEPSVTIADTEIGWLDNESDLPDVIPEVDSILASEISLNRQVDVKFIDPDKEWDANTQSAKRQITEGAGVELVEVQLCLLADEARAVAQRKLYRDYVAGTAHRFTLSWKYLYLYPGYKITITRAEGFSHVLRLTSISGGLGVLECEGVALEPSVFTQPTSATIPGFDPNRPVPAMTILTLLDIPIFNEGHATINQGIIQYAAGTERTGFNQSWIGFAAWISRNNIWNALGQSKVPATIGVVVSAVNLSTDPDTTDNIGVITVDLYGTTATLSSVTEAEMINGENLALAGDMIFGFATASQVAGFPNRWNLSVLRNGLKDTDDHVSDNLTNARFVLLDEAVIPIPMELSDLNNTRNYKGITAGQSLDDAATIAHVWTGNSLRPRKPTGIIAARDGSGDWMVQCELHPRAFEIPAEGVCEIWESPDRSDPFKMKRQLPLVQGAAQAALLVTVNPTDLEGGKGEPDHTIISTHTDKNNLLHVGGGISANTLQVFGQKFMRLEFTIDDSHATTPDLSNSQHFGFTEDGTSAAVGVAETSMPFYLKLVQGAGSTGDIQIRHYTTTITTLNYTYTQLIAGLRFTLIIVGREYRAYLDYKFGDPPLAVYQTPGDGPPFPLRGAFDVWQTTDCKNIMVGLGPSYGTIYSSREQIEDFGVNQSQLFLRICQKARFEGIGNPVDV